jgi:phosphatidylglycerol:prolipoprotein diacylglycerol transferase
VAGKEAAMHPILFEIPIHPVIISLLAALGFDSGNSLPIYSYGVMLGTSMILGWNVVMYFGKREAYLKDPKANEDFLANAFIVCALSAILGARILYFITVPEDFTSIMDVFAIRRGGLVAYGGFLGGFFAAIGWVRIYKGVALLRFADGAAPALGLGLGLTRIGCYLYGCDFGGRLEADAPSWLQSLGTFPHWHDNAGSPAWSWHVQQYNLDYAAEGSFPVHPTQLYESLFGLVLFGLCLFVWSRRQFHGQVLLVLTMAYSVWRFLIEIVRDDPGRGGAFDFTTSQIISLILFPLAAFFYMTQYNAWKAKPYKVIRLFSPLPEPVLVTGAKAADEDDEDDDKPAVKSSEKAETKADEKDEASEKEDLKKTASDTPKAKKKS